MSTQQPCLQSENEQLRAGYAAARLEIESLRERVQQLGQLARDVNSRRVTELEAQLAAVGAGGVEPLRKRECLHQITEPAQPLVCDYCGALTPDPWHSSGMLHGKMSKHIHSCDSCAAQQGESIEQEAMQMLWNDQQPEEKEHYHNVARGAERIK